jgi:hypothetical protein
MKTSPPLAVVGCPLVAVPLALVSSMLAAGCRTDTIRAQTIYLEDDKGRSRLVMHGGHGTQGPMIAFRTENGDEGDKTGLAMSLTKTGSKGEGPTVAFISAYSSEIGCFSLAARPDGAHLQLGGDDTESFGINCDKDGLVIALEPKGELDPDSGVLSAAKKSASKEARGVRITLDKGRIIVHDLAGHEIAALPDAAPSAPISPH